GSPILINGPGEYEIKNVYIQGIPAFHDNNFGKERGQITIYSITSEDIRICHLSDLGQKELFAEQIEDIGEIDILFVPVGGTFTIDAQEAAKIINQIEPRIVIPMHYQLPGLKMKLDPVEKFLKVMGQKSVETLPKLTIKQKDLPQEGPKIILLKS
ncbi:MAG: MBL fold metallo-hydrolase, partial [bacterium]|nr:MBL fold metallo-hydrolase [bacterium]